MLPMFKAALKHLKNALEKLHSHLSLKFPSLIAVAGAEVVFSVDCTKLQEHFSPGKREFDRVYFNFPHCGRKTGVAKNRELLARFFHRRVNQK